MTRPARIALISAGTVVFLLAVAVVAGILVARSDWLREKFRERIVTEAERATGGRVEIGKFQLDWSTLTAEIDNLVIHGTEPSGSEPLLTIRRLSVGFKIISLMKRDFDIASVTADSPRTHLIVHADGTTNIPRPKNAVSGKTVPETILALKIGTFDLSNGLVITEREGGPQRPQSEATPWSARGENLAAHVTYNAAGVRYDGSLSVAPLHFALSGFGPVDIQVAATASMERNRLLVSSATLTAGESRVDLSNVLVNGFTAPVITARYRARISLTEADRVFRLVNFRHTGTLNSTGDIRYVSSTDYLVTGAVQGAGIGYGRVRNMRVAGNLTAAPDSIAVSGLRIGALGGELTASAEVRHLRDVHVTGRLQHFDAATLASLGGLTKLPYDGVLSGPFDATGRLQEPYLHRLFFSVALTVSPAGSGPPVQGEIAAKYDGAAGTLELGQSWLALPQTRIDVSGVLGRTLNVKAQSRDLNDLAPVLKGLSLPVKLTNGGSVAFDGSVSGPLENPRIAGHAAILNAVYEGQPIDSLAGGFTATASEATVTDAALDWGNLHARVGGSVSLSHWKPVKTSAVNANVRITNATVANLLAIADRKDIPVSGTLNAASQVTGTIGDPHANANFTLTKGQIYGEPFDSVTGSAQYLNGGPQVLTAAVDAGRKRLNVTARYAADKLAFSVSSNAMVLNQIALARKAEPGLSGTALIKADGVLQIHGKRIDFVDLNGDLNATGLGLGARSFGDLRLTARTANGILTARLDSNAAQASIHGEGTVGLGGNHPVNARLTFSKVELRAVAVLMSPLARKNEPNFDGSAAGEVTVTGPAGTPDLLVASFDVSQFELHPLVVTGDARNIPDLALKNNGPIRATLSKSVIRVDSARFQAPDTSLDVSGTIALKDRLPLNLRVQGNLNLALAETFDQDLMSSGQLAINSAVRGAWTNPEISGRADLQMAEFHYAGFSNGLTNAKGVFLFTGPRATIQSFSAESGGGKVQATGFAALTNGLFTFRLEAKTRDVRVRYPPGVSSVSDADITLAGTSNRSEASGTVVIRRISINPKSDISSIIASAAEPIRTPEARPGILGNMNMDIQIETAPDVAFQTSVAQSIEADANLRLRGTVLNPAVLGRINITQGEIVFFGNKYTINQGSISFFNPARIDPILNFDLETKARGVDVTLTVNGPINKPNLSVRSDPPLQFGDIVALLATGRSPTDPTLAVQNTGQSQSLQQIGGSALIGQAIANPVAGNLQRFFGVSRIKIDPQITGITGSPEARLTIEQQVTPDLLFTYISDVSNTSTQLLQVEWDFSRRWSAILTREENGYVGIDFAFKKRFK